MQKAHAAVVAPIQRHCNRIGNVMEKSNARSGRYGVTSIWREDQQVHLRKRQLGVT